MTKEEYKIAYNELLKKELEIQEQMRLLDDSFLEEHLTVKPGDKVKVRWEEYGGAREEIAYVTSLAVSMDGEITHWFIKAKKDGSPSSQRLRTYGAECTVELIEAAKIE